MAKTVSKIRSKDKRLYDVADSDVRRKLAQIKLAAKDLENLDPDNVSSADCATRLNELTGIFKGSLSILFTAALSFLTLQGATPTYPGKWTPTREGAIETTWTNHARTAGARWTMTNFFEYIVNLEEFLAAGGGGGGANKRDTIDVASYRPKNRIWRWESSDPNCPTDFLTIANDVCQLEPKWYDVGSGQWEGGAVYNADGVVKYLPKQETTLPSTATIVSFTYVKLDDFGRETDELFVVTAKRDTNSDTTPTQLTGTETNLASLDDIRSRITFATLRKYYNKAMDAVKELLGPAYVDTKEVSLGGGATNLNHMESITLNGCIRHPSFTWGFANINIGLDNIVGYGDDGFGGVIQTDGSIKTNANYATVVGTSSTAKYMHSYVFGSQSHASAPNAFIFGYGATATDPDSTIIGFGVRPVADKKFDTRANMLAWFKSFANYTAATNAIPFVDYMISITNDTIEARIPESYNGEYYVKSIRSSKDSTYGWVELYKDAPGDERDEYIRGRHNWNYGKTHGRGTINLVAKGGGEDLGLGSIYINDRSVKELIQSGDASKMELTPEQKKKFNFEYHGYNENAAVELGKDAHAEPDISGETGGRIRSVSIAIGAQANASNGKPGLTSQAIAIGYCAKASGSQAIALGAGSRHFDDEDDISGDNTAALADKAMAIGYSTKAYGKESLAVGTGTGGKNETRTCALADKSVAIGTNARANKKSSVAIGSNVKADAEGSFVMGSNAAVADTAIGSVQIGTGTNTVAGTLQFGNVTVVKDGHVVGSVPDPQSVDPTQGGTKTEELEIDVAPGSMTTVLPKAPTGPGTEVGVHCSGLRNYTVFLPNEPNVRAGLPASFAFELPADVKGSFVGPKSFTKLPVKFVMEQPYEKMAIVTAIQLDDGSDWKPVITNSLIFYDSATRTFKSTGNSIEGMNLHAGTKFQLKYTSNGGAEVVKDLMTKSADAEFMGGTFYNFCSAVNLQVSADEAPPFTDPISATIVYETVNGPCPPVTVNIEYK